MTDEQKYSELDHQILPHNEPVTFVVSVLLCWDGDPETEGSEYYAPKGWKPDPKQHAGLVITGDRFVTTGGQAQALVAAGCGRIEAFKVSSPN